MISHRVTSRVIGNCALWGWGIDPYRSILFHIHWFKKQFFEGWLLGVFKQHPLGSVEAPYLESGAKQTALWKKVVQTGHRMETTDGNLAFLVQPIVGPVFDGPAVEQVFALDAAVKPFLPNFVRAPHRYRVLRV